MKKIPYGYHCIRETDIRAVTRALRSGHITQGGLVDRFERSLARSCGCRYAVAVSSGTAALHLACLAVGVSAGDEVITSPVTFAASSNSVLYCGGRPVFADVLPDVPNIDPAAILRKVTKKTRGLIPVHYAGFPCDMPQIHRLAQKHGLWVIEDAAHALGSSYSYQKKNIKIGSCRHSDLTIFSFHPVKAITTAEGGAVTTNDPKLYERLRALRTHGICRDAQSMKQGPWYYEMRDLGFNYRLTDLQCALGLSQLKILNSFIVRRKKIAAFYQKAFAGNPFFDVLEAPAGSHPAWHLYPIVLRKPFWGKRKEIFLRLRDMGIFCQVHYIPVYWHPVYQKLGFRRGLCPRAEDFYQGELSIPLFPAMKDSDAATVVAAVNKACGYLRKARQ